MLYLSLKNTNFVYHLVNSNFVQIKSYMIEFMKKIMIITLCFISVCSLLAQNASEESNGIMAENSGWNKLKQGEYDSSIGESRKALKLDSSLSYAHFNIALAYLLKGENETSLKEYKDAITRAKKFGIPNKKFKAAIDDILKYMEVIQSKSVANDIIQLIENVANNYLETTIIFLHVPKAFEPTFSDSKNGYFDNIQLNGVKITTIDVSGNSIWVSEKITDFVENYSELLLKIEIPKIVLLKSKKVDCQYFYSTTYNKPGGAQSIITEYFKENRDSDFPNIKLNLNSIPNGAEIFLVPNRVWIKEFKGKNWSLFSENYMDRFRVNGTTTNTFTQIDETVYVIIFKLDGKYKTRTYYTKPAQIQPEQTVIITF